MMDKRAALITSLGVAGSPVYALNFRLQGILLKRSLISCPIQPYIFFLWQYIYLGILYLAALCLIFRSGTLSSKAPCTLYIILSFAVLYRLFLVPTHPVLSSDMYRYIWDGRVQSHSINPYRYPPGHVAVQRLRDGAIYPYINRKGSPSIYPAGSQILFYLLNRLGARSVVSFKGMLFLFDMASLLLLVMILANLGLTKERVLVYAWNPLVIYELTNNGHLDGVVVFFLLLALWLLVKERPNGAVSSLAVAASLKLYPAVVLPAILKEKKIPRLFLFGLIFFLFYIPYLSVRKKVLGFLPEYLTNPYESFNLGLKAYIMKSLPSLSPLLITEVFAGALVVAAGVVWIRKKEETVDAFKQVYILAGLLILLSPASLHPWYVLWLVPFLSLFPSPAWLYFSLTVPFSYLKYESPLGILPEWVRHMEYVPLFILLTVEYLAFHRSSRPLFPWRSRWERAPVKTL